MKIDTLRKVAMLAVNGEPGERDAAESILKSNGVTAEQILADSEPNVPVEVTFKNKQERTLITQLYCKYMNESEIEYYRIKNRRIRFYLPKPKVDIFLRDLETILKSYRKEIDTFLCAFIQANRLFPDLEDDNSEISLTTDEIENIINMARGIRKVVLGPLLNKKNP